MKASIELKFWFFAILFAALMLAVPVKDAFAFKATLILEHTEQSPWYELLLSGLKKAQKDFNIETQVVYARGGENQTAVFREAAQSSELVLVATDNMHEILRDNAANFRRVMFGSIDAGIRASNIMSVTFADEQASFLAGYAAAILTASANLHGMNAQKTIGWLSGMDTPALRSLVNGYIEGAKLANPEVQVAQSVADSFTDTQKAGLKAQNLLANNADIIALAAGAANRGAILELDKAEAWHINLDQNLSGARTLGSIVKAADKAVYEIIASSQEKFKAKEIIVYNLENGGVNFELGEELVAKKNELAAIKNIIRRINELKKEIAKGAIYIKSLRRRTLCDCLD